jgi:hypothetical protein
VFVWGPRFDARQLTERRSWEPSKMMDADSSARCNHCKQPLIEINNRSERLWGCLTCNLWAAANSKRWERLSEEDLRALHQLHHSRG